MKTIALIALFFIFSTGFAQKKQPVAKPTPKPAVTPVTPAPTPTPTAPVPMPAEASAPTPMPAPAPEPEPMPSNPPKSVEASNSSEHLFGFNVGVGFPYLAMVGINYVHSSGFISAELGLNSLNIKASEVTVTMKKTELSLKWHPFAGSFYLGAGFGNQSLSGTSKETISSQSVEAKIEITSNTLTPQIGWMWGISDGGFFGGIDFGFQSPSGVKSTLTTNADPAVKATADYQKLEADVRDQGKKLGEIGIPTMTLIRLGYLF